MTYEEILNDAKQARELGDSDLELKLLEKADTIWKSGASARHGNVMNRPVPAVSRGVLPDLYSGFESKVTGEELPPETPAGQVGGALGGFSHGVSKRGHDILSLGGALYKNPIPSLRELPSGENSGIPEFLGAMVPDLVAMRGLSMAAPLLRGIHAANLSGLAQYLGKASSALPYLEQIPSATGKALGTLAESMGAPSGDYAAAKGVLGNALYGGATSQDRTSGAAGGGIGGAVGGLGKTIAEALLTPGRSAAEMGKMALNVSKARAMGVEPTLADILPGSKFSFLEDVSGKLPAGMEATRQRAMANSEAIKNAVYGVANQVGPKMERDVAGQEVLGGLKASAADQLRQAWEDITNSAPDEVNINTPEVRQAYQDVLNAARPVEKLSGGRDYRSLASLAEDVLGDTGGVVPPKNITSRTIDRTVDTQKDDLISAIRKLGGIRRDTLDQYAGPSFVGNNLKFSPNPVGPVHGPNGTMSLDDMAQALHEHGYLSERDIGELSDKLADSAAGTSKPVFSMYKNDYSGQDPLAYALERLTQKLDAKRAPPAPRVGTLAETPVVPKQVYETTRSSLSSDAAEKSGAAKRMYMSLATALDDAAGVPKELQKTYSGIAKRAEPLNATSDYKTYLDSLFSGNPAKLEHLDQFGNEQIQNTARRALIDKAISGAKDTNGNFSTKKFIRMMQDYEEGTPEVVARKIGGEPMSQIMDIADTMRPFRNADPDSYTAQRMQAIHLLTHPAALFAGGAALHGYGSQNEGYPGKLATLAGVLMELGAGAETVHNVLTSPRAVDFMLKGGLPKWARNATYRIPAATGVNLADTLSGNQ